ncbi:50S ribosomal protein L15 [Candidatus Uhrbacteria bacterium]|nr:50S ribosomal protein L15 [Candidatus Uhrbacteria bacterium]
MPLSLHTLRPQKGSQKSKKRVGRGLGSTGTYSGRGVKGQSARSGVSGLKLQGLRSVMLSTPKMRGFKSGYERAQVVNVDDLSKTFKAGMKVTPKLLEQAGLIGKASSPVKVLGEGAIAISIILSGCRVSASAKQKIEAAGGNIIS